MSWLCVQVTYFVCKWCMCASDVIFVCVSDVPAEMKAAMCRLMWLMLCSISIQWPVEPIFLRIDSLMTVWVLKAGSKRRFCASQPDHFICSGTVTDDNHARKKLNRMVRTCQHVLSKPLHVGQQLASPATLSHCHSTFPSLSSQWPP